VRAIVLGATGMVGHTVAVYLSEQDCDVSAFSRSLFPYGRHIAGDVTDRGFLEKTILDGGYDVVINCVGLLNKAAEEAKPAAVYLNSYLPHHIADVIKGTDTKLIHISTDCVFSGKTGQYHEGSPRDGETFYARSKALGEVDDHKNLTFRTSIIGPDIHADGVGLFNWFMKQDSVVEGYTQALWTGVTSLTLAKAILPAIERDISGIYHLVNGGPISKYDLLGLFNHYFKNDKIVIVPSDKVAADKSLVNNRRDFSFSVPDYGQMIAEMKLWIERHRELYPHYM
jgi:dTDP-4-dehydrorhamnose reductase